MGCCQTDFCAGFSFPAFTFVTWHAKADDYGYNDISYHARMNGNDTNIIETPNMDALAVSEPGMVFHA